MCCLASCILRYLRGPAAAAAVWSSLYSYRMITLRVCATLGTTAVNMYTCTELSKQYLWGEELLTKTYLVFYVPKKAEKKRGCSSRKQQRVLSASFFQVLYIHATRSLKNDPDGLQLTAAV